MDNLKLEKGYNIALKMLDRRNNFMNAMDNYNNFIKGLDIEEVEQLEIFINEKAFDRDKDAQAIMFIIENLLD